jgi:hypothetical protein
MNNRILGLYHIIITNIICCISLTDKIKAYKRYSHSLYF